MSEFGRGIDPFQVGLLQCLTFGVGDEGLAKSENTLLGSNTTSVQHKEVILDLTVMREASHWGDCLVGHIGFSGGVILDKFATFFVDSSPDTVDLLVDLSTMMVSLLT